MGIPSFISKDCKINKTSVSQSWKGWGSSVQGVFMLQKNRSKADVSVREIISLMVWYDFMLLPLKSLTALLRDRTLTSDWEGPRFPVLRDWNISPETTESLPVPPHDSLLYPGRQKHFPAVGWGRTRGAQLLKPRKTWICLFWWPSRAHKETQAWMWTQQARSGSPMC